MQRSRPAGRSAISRFDLLNGTVALQFNNFQVSAGNNVWWSITEGGPLLLSDNAEPFSASSSTMFRPTIFR